MYDDVFIEIKEERNRQDKKWGEQNHDPLYWLGILMEEVGEASKAAIESDFPQYRREIVHVAAVAVQMIECYQRKVYRGQ